ncbi:ABC-three component system middle component 2 [Sorangium sp. So ce362]|uniref:ABC-three component system middle component 2 n=1 Tax=Sorangium sp. So ce362 TaxID=3133303 RepID=UPI003F613FF6
MSETRRSDHLFNTPIESGLRSLFILEAVKPQSCDLQRLVIYDYLLVHSNDVIFGPESLHPPTPLRSGELFVRRNLVERGLHLLFRKGLVAKTFAKSGIVYAATGIAGAFLAYLNSSYAIRCAEISKWIAGRFHELSDEQLKDLIDENLGRWGAEFTREPVLWEDVE